MLSVHVSMYVGIYLCMCLCVYVCMLYCFKFSLCVQMLVTSRLSMISSSSAMMSSSSRPSSVVVQRITDNLSFLPASSAHYMPSSAHDGPSATHVDTSQRPIVLIYAWLAAKSRHIHKFGDFYLGTSYLQLGTRH